MQTALLSMSTPSPATESLQINNFTFVNQVKSIIPSNPRIIGSLDIVADDTIKATQPIAVAGKRKRKGNLTAQSNPNVIQSCFRGVCWNKSHRSWHARIEFDGKREHLGYFNTQEGAAKAYDRRAVDLFGKNAIVNFPQSLDNVNEGSEKYAPYYCGRRVKREDAAVVREVRKKRRTMHSQSHLDQHEMVSPSSSSSLKSKPEPNNFLSKDNSNMLGSLMIGPEVEPQLPSIKSEPFQELDRTQETQFSSLKEGVSFSLNPTIQQYQSQPLRYQMVCPTYPHPMNFVKVVYEQPIGQHFVMPTAAATVPFNYHQRRISPQQSHLRTLPISQFMGNSYPLNTTTPFYFCQ